MNNVTMMGVAVAGLTAGAMGQVGLVDFDGTEIGLISYTNDALVGGGLSTNGNLSSLETYAFFASSGDAFNPMSRSSLAPMEADGGQIGMPFAISDDSVAAATGNTVFANDVQGFAGQAKQDGFFGISDTVNSSSPTGTQTADFVFNIAGFTDLSVAMDFAAMGDFENNDVFNFTYSIDGGSFQSLFTSSLVAGVNQSYTMDSGAIVDLADPIAINGVTLNDEFQTIVAGVAGTGSELTIRVEATTDGGSEAFGFDNMLIRGIPTPATAALLGLGGLVGLRRRR